MVLPTNKVLSLEQFFLYSSMHVFIPGEQFSTFQEVQRNCSCNIKCPSAFEVACPINMVPFYKGSYCRFRLVVVSEDLLQVSLLRKPQLKIIEMSVRKEGYLIHL